MSVTAKATPYALDREDGEALWLLGSLSRLKATAESTGGALTLMEIYGPEGMAVPLHTHGSEEEAWYLIDGEVIFQVQDRIVAASPGAFVFVPRGVPHGFRIRSRTARFLDIRTPAGFEGFFRAAGDPAQASALPPAGPPDVERLAAAAPHFGMTIVGPPPADAD